MNPRSRSPLARAPVAAVILASVLALGPLALRGPSFDGPGLCHVPPPVVTLATTSKIDAADPTGVRTVADTDRREATLAPLRAAIRSVARVADGEADERRCAAHSLALWARADALTDVRTKDAVLTRGRLGAELLVAAVLLDRAGAFDAAQRRAVVAWAERLSRSTIDLFGTHAGSETRVNNHRQWAGLLVGAGGLLTGRPEYLAWAREGANAALCSVTADGFLPAELKRGRRAWRYHRYALRPLLAMRALGVHENAPDPCAAGLARLERVAADKGSVERKAGIAQDGPAAETTFGPALRLPAALSRS